MQLLQLCALCDLKTRAALLARSPPCPTLLCPSRPFIALPMTAATTAISLPCRAVILFVLGFQNQGFNWVHGALVSAMIASTDALAATAGQNRLLTLGMKPTRPDTGYGYIQFHEDEEKVKKVKTFTEKPELALARSFLESGDFVWNAGIFIWNAKAILASLEIHQTELYELFHEGMAHFWTDSEQAFINRVYPQCKNISVDNGIMEKADNVFVMLADFGWSDLGTWKSLYELSEKDENGNVVNANAMLYDTYNSVIRVGKDKLVVVEGVDNLIIAEADGVIMICHKDHEQRVKDFVADAKQSPQNRKFI